MKSLSTFRILLASFLLVITEQIGGKSSVFEKHLKTFEPMMKMMLPCVLEFLRFTVYVKWESVWILKRKIMKERRPFFEQYSLF